MDYFTFAHLFNGENWKACKRRMGAYIAIVIALGALVPGATIKLFGQAPGDSGFWHWLWHGETVIDADFSNTKGRVRLVDLNGEWRFAAGDDASRAQPDFDDSSWSAIDVSASWEDQGYKDYDGYAWYRRVFDLDEENLSQPLYAFLGKIDDVDEVFINGRSIGGLGGFPSDFSTAWNAERVYRVPSDLLNVGGNVIAIRVYDARAAGGVTGKSLGLYTTNLPRPLIDLSGRWEFRTGNDPGWTHEAVNGTGFETIRVPGNWDYAGYKDYDGHAWYRTTFGPLPVAENETLILFLGKIDDTDEVFLNGRRIGGSDRYDMHRRYEFSSNLLKEANVLAVHVYDGQQGGGIYAGPIGIMRKTDFIEYRMQAKERKEWRVGETIDWLLGRD
jgi:hypothetical protein